MIKYTKRFYAGTLTYIARINKVEFAKISECETFKNTFNVQFNHTGDAITQFNSIDAAKNYVETIANIRA